MKKHNDRSIKETLGLFLQKNRKLEKGLNHVQIERVYRDKMGELINKYTREIVLKGNVLHLYITSAPLKNELLMNQNKIISFLNEEVGSKVVTELKIF